MRRFLLGLAVVAFVTSGAMGASLDTVPVLADNVATSGGGHQNMSNTVVWGLAPDGTVAGSALCDITYNGTVYDPGVDTPITWTKAGGTVIKNDGWRNGKASGVGNNGYVAGTVSDIGKYSTSVAGGWSTLQNSSNNVAAGWNSVSGTGSYIVGASTKTNDAHRWSTPPGAPTYVAGAAGNTGAHGFRGVSDAGACVGTDKHANGGGQDGATYWSGAGAAVGVPPFAGEITDKGQGGGISDNGTYVTGYMLSPNAGYVYRGFIWSPGDANATPRNPVGSDTLSYAYEAANDGSCVGWSYGAEGPNPDGSYDAVKWDAAGSPQFIQTMLANAGVDVSGWKSLYKSQNVTPDGLTMAGYGFEWIDPNDHDAGSVLRGWVATIPEPATLSFLALGGLALLRRRR